jgi:hypothetical protein
VKRGYAKKYKRKFSEVTISSTTGIYKFINSQVYLVTSGQETHSNMMCIKEKVDKTGTMLNLFK